MLMLPTIGKGAVAMVNSIQGWPLPAEIVAAVGREYGWPPLKDVPKVAALEAESDYAGTYEKDGAQLRITPQGTGLLVEFPHQQAIAVYPTAVREFFAKAINLRLTFGDADPARPSELTVIHGPKKEVFKRAD
jgi:hypothetical protein